MAHSVLRQMLKDIREVRYFSILADETRDINNQEQLSICIRWVGSDFVIHEDFIGLCQVEKTTASFLTDAIKDILLRCTLPLSLCRGQGYDGAAAMMGHLNGVATQLQKEESRAIPVHCFAHSLNLCLQDAAKSCNIVRDSLSLIQEICQLICFSPKRQSLFNTLKKDLSPDVIGLRPLCPTRWTVRTRAIKSVLDNYEALKQVFEEVNQTCADDYGRRAGGILSQMELFSTYFGLELCYLIFSKTESVSSKLQAKDVTILQGLEYAEFGRESLQTQRTDESFHHFYERVKQSATKFTSEPCLPRRRRVPRSLDDGTDQHFDVAPEDFYRRTYYEVLDRVIQDLRRRFSQKSLEVPQKVESLIVKAANWPGAEELQVDQSVIDFYKEDINVPTLKNELHMLSNFVKQVKLSKKEFSSVQEVKDVRTVANMLSASDIGLPLFREVAILVRLFMTIPVSTASSERSFSALRRLKTYLRSSMTAQRLNHIALLHCHKERTDSLDLTDVAEEFSSSNETRRKFFGAFLH